MAAGNVKLFLSALQQFSQGVKQLQVQRSITQANEAVQQIRQSELEEAQKTQAFRDISQDLSFDLAQADPRFVGQAIRSLAPPQPTQLGLQQQAQEARLGFQEKQQEFQAEQQTERLASQERAAQARAEISAERDVGRKSFKLQKERRGTLSKSQKEFNAFTKDIRKAQVQATNAIKLIDSGSPLTASVVGVLMARASGEVGNLSATEQAAFRGSQDVISRINRFLQLGTISQLPEGDKQALKEIAKLYLGTQNQLEREFATQLTNQVKSNELFAEDSLDNVISNVSGGRIKQFIEPSQTAPPGTTPQGRRRFLTPFRPAQPAAQPPPPVVDSEQRRRQFLVPRRGGGSGNF